MAFHKARALQEAEKSVAQGNMAWPSSYIKTSLIATLPTYLFSTQSGLYVRDRNISEGLKQFHKLAAAYVRDGDRGL